MKLSIIVPVYNMASGSKLQHCLDSLIVGNLVDCEIIPVDDASTDSSASIIADYQSRYPDLIKPIYNKINRKQGGARNSGLDAACGEWIGFVDSDDWVAPDMFSKLLSRAEETGADVVGCQYSIVSEYTMTPGQIVAIHSSDQCGVYNNFIRRRMIRQPGSMVVKIYKSSVIRENNLRFCENTFYEDNQAGPLWMLAFTHFELVDEPLYFYYQHETSTVHTVNLDRLHNRMDMAASMISIAKEKGYFDCFPAEFEASFIRLYYANTLFSYMQNSKHAQLTFLRELQMGMKNTFPYFMSNPAFSSEYDAEQQKMMRLHYHSPFLYRMYDRALRVYRHVRYHRA